MERSTRNSLHSSIGRREFLAAAALAIHTRWATAAQARPIQFNYMLASCMYGYASVETVMQECRKTGASVIDIWPKVHGNQREQLDELGTAKFQQLLGKYDITLGCITQYKLGPFQLHDEFRVAQELECRTIVTGAHGPPGLKGDALKSAIQSFLRELTPHLQKAEAHGITIAIENHANNLMESSDAIRWLADLRPSPNLTIALAPYHLDQDATQLASLIRDLHERLHVFYAWQHGLGCMKAQPKEDELQQMPGRGPLDFGPLVKALSTIEFAGWTEIFMHPFPRGLPILETPAEVTAEINRARSYLERLM